MLNNVYVVRLGLGIWFGSIHSIRIALNRFDSNFKYHKNQYSNTECRMRAFYMKIEFSFNGKCNWRINLLIGRQHLRTMERMLIDRKMDFVDFDKFLACRRQITSPAYSLIRRHVDPSAYKSSRLVSVSNSFKMQSSCKCRNSNGCSIARNFIIISTKKNQISNTLFELRIF